MCSISKLGGQSLSGIQTYYLHKQLVKYLFNCGTYKCFSGIRDKSFFSGTISHILERLTTLVRVIVDTWIRYAQEKEECRATNRGDSNSHPGEYIHIFKDNDWAQIIEQLEFSKEKMQ